MAEVVTLEEFRLTRDEREQAQSDLAAFVIGSLDPEDIDERTLAPTMTLTPRDWGDSTVALVSRPTMTFNQSDWGGPTDAFPQAS